MKMLLIVIGAICAAGCNHTGKSRWHSTATMFYLTPRELEGQRTLAERGDADAAYRVYEYYDMCLQNRSEAAAWLQRAADLGNLHARSWCALRLVEKDDDASRAAGLRMIRISAAAGDWSCMSYLENMRWFLQFTDSQLEYVQRYTPAQFAMVRYLRQHPDELTGALNLPNNFPQPAAQGGRG